MKYKQLVLLALIFTLASKGKAQGTWAVSYTHLDVYKRQA